MKASVLHVLWHAEGPPTSPQNFKHALEGAGRRQLYPNQWICFVGEEASVYSGLRASVCTMFCHGIDLFMQALCTNLHSVCGTHHLFCVYKKSIMDQLHYFFSDLNRIVNKWAGL